TSRSSLFSQRRNKFALSTASVASRSVKLECKARLNEPGFLFCSETKPPAVVLSSTLRASTLLRPVKSGTGTGGPCVVEAVPTAASTGTAATAMGENGQHAASPDV